MTNLELPASIRCYDGAWDSATQRVFDAQDAAMAKLRLVEPEAHATYFPMEGKWLIHVWGRELSAYHATKGSAIADACTRKGIVL